MRQLNFGFIVDISSREKLLVPKHHEKIFFCKTTESKTFFDVCFDVDENTVQVTGCDVQINIGNFDQLLPKGEADFFWLTNHFRLKFEL